MVKQEVVVITGGAGFVGSHLCDRFIADSFKVICVDNLITGATRNIEHLLSNPNFQFVNQDVSQQLQVEGPVHYVMHFASPASPVDYLNFPIETLKVGSIGTLNALELAKDKKSRFMMASTSEVYGDPKEHPQKETYWGNVNPIGPRGVYDEAKRFSEALTLAYHRKHNVDTKLIRIFNTYGPRMAINDGRVVPNFIDQMMHDQPLTIYGDGKQTRSFCYVADLVEGIVRMVKSQLTGPVNLGNPREFTIIEFANLVNQLSNKNLKFIYKSLPQDDPKQRRPDISLAKRELDWEPKIPLEQGLKTTIDWFLANQDKLNK